MARPRFIWVCAVGISFLLSTFAALRGGYVGPDYPMHLARLTQWQQVFDFSATSPPTYYLLGHGLFLLIGSNNAFPITLSIAQAGTNAVAMWYFFRFTQRRFEWPIIHLALVLFLTFLPVRVIHAVTIGTDSLTIPCFVLVLFLFDRFLVEESSAPKNAALLGLGLGLAVWVKYSFMALVPAIFGVLICIWRKRRWKLNRFIAICALALILPSALSLHSFWASSRVHGYNTEKHWLPKGAAPDMNYRDLLSIKARDIRLFRAPEYFKREILAPHEHSYLALSHLGVFTDTMNLFQDLAVRQRFESILIPDQKIRRSWKTYLMRTSMSLGVVWMSLALVSTPWTLFRALRNLVENKLQPEDSVAFLGSAYFLLILLLIPFVYAGALFGYWTPRLILPALLYFFLSAFLLIDRKIVKQRHSGQIAAAVLAIVIGQCAIEAVMLA